MKCFDGCVCFFVMCVISLVVWLSMVKLCINEGGILRLFSSVVIVLVVLIVMCLLVVVLIFVVSKLSVL